MLRPALAVAFLALAATPLASGHGFGADSMASAARTTVAGCVVFEGSSDQGPVKAGQEDPGVFVGAPLGILGTLVTSEVGGAYPPLQVGGSGGYTGVGVFYRSRDCELPGSRVLETLL